MDKASKYFAIRRSTRLPLEIPVRVTSLDPKIQFTENCTTVTVSAHGCGVIASRQVASGTPVQLEIVVDQQRTNARVLEVVPLNDEKTSWLLGMELERPGNFWGIKYAPVDWAEEERQAPPAAAKPAGGDAQPSTTPQGAAAAEVSASAPEAPPYIHLPLAKKATKSAPAPAGQRGTAEAEPSKNAKTAAPTAAAKATELPIKPSPAPAKEISAAVLRRLLSECRLAAISVGACYVQTGTTFPIHAPVRLVVHAGGKEHRFHGTVRIEHVGAGMGLEFSGSGSEHEERIAKLIEALSANGDKVPDVRVELAAPDKSGSKPKSASAAAAEYDSLLALVLSGGALKRSDFLQELEKQRQRG